MFNKRSSSAWWHIILLTALAVIAFFPWLGSVHLFDWDEINFAEAAREMLVTGDYSRVQINFEPFYEKPPLFFWLQVLSMKIWGINEFAARFPNALFGIFTLLTLYFIGKREMNGRLGLLWALMHLSALLPHFYFKTGIIDPVFNYFIFLGIYSLVRLLDKPFAHVKWAWMGGLSIGLAILTKGPVGALIPALVGLVYWVKNRLKPIISWYALSILSAAAIILPLAWLDYEAYYHGIDFIKNFIIYQIELFSQPVAGHGQPFYYHFVVVFLGCFPASVLGIGDLFKFAPMDKSRMLLPMMKILFWVVMILFSLATTKIVHYSSMAYFPISFLAACYLYQIDQRIIVASSTMQVAFLVLGCLIAAVFTALPVVALHKDWLHPFITDSFTLASLNMPVPWDIQDCMVGLSYLFFNLIAFYFFNKRAILLFVGSCVIATTCCLTLGTLQIIPKIEIHTQRPAIDFYKSLVGKPAYVTAVGFKSYAPLFYFQQPLGTHVSASELPWLMTGQLDRSAYFVIKLDDISKLLEYPAIKLLYIEGGFAFFKKDAEG